jgi:hypothetical protein
MKAPSGAFISFCRSIVPHALEPAAAPFAPQAGWWEACGPAPDGLVGACVAGWKSASTERRAAVERCEQGRAARAVDGRRRRAATSRCRASSDECRWPGGRGWCSAAARECRRSRRRSGAHGWCAAAPHEWLRSGGPGRCAAASNEFGGSRRHRWPHGRCSAPACRRRERGPPEASLRCRPRSAPLHWCRS